jgi:molecular chaperone DnaK (HSP70)
VYATDGDDTLGGSDLDLCLYDILLHKLRAHPLLLAQQQQQQLRANDDTAAAASAAAASATASAAGSSSSSFTTDREKEKEEEEEYKEGIPPLCSSLSSVRVLAESIKKQLTFRESVQFRCRLPPVR